MKKKAKLNDTLEEFKKYFLKIKYLSKCKKISISKDLLEVLIERNDFQETKDILKFIQKSSNQEEFNRYIIEYCIKNKESYIATYFLLGIIIGKYDFYDLSKVSIDEFNFNHFNDKNYQDVLKILREHWIEYISNDNKIKNQFLINQKGEYDYNLELDEEKCLTLYDEVIKGNLHEDTKIPYHLVRNYIVQAIGIYGSDVIKNNFDFILYDLQFKDKSNSLGERKKKYLEFSHLSNNKVEKLHNLGKLKEKLKKLNTNKSMELLKEIEKMDDKNFDISKIEDIYSEYEILFREDIISHLFNPTKEVTIVDDFRDLKPQLLHVFIRNPEKFRNDLEGKLIEDIKKERKNQSDIFKELTKEEQEEFIKRKQLLDVMLNPTQVNYSYDGKSNYYSDKNGWTSYHSDTNNQISTTLYSKDYYLEHFIPWTMGIGFNQEGLNPEAIVLSSKNYLTTNKGLNHLEYCQKNEFDLMSSNYYELLENDGKSEVVLFRRNIDYDTKASYIFLTIDTSNPTKCEEVIKEARELASKSKMKLVIYDLKKIASSYETYLRINNHFSHEEKLKHRK